MPDQPPSKRRPAIVPFRGAETNHDGTRRGASSTRKRRALRYAELHCRTNFSFLEGASHPDELVARAAELGSAALAVTDRNSVAGVVRAHVAAKEAGLKLLVGAEITPVDAPPVVLLATDRAAYGRLTTLITRGRRRAEKGECFLTFDDVAEHAAGLVGCVVPGDRGSRIEDREEGVAPQKRSRMHVITSTTRKTSLFDLRSSILDPRSSALRNYRDVFGDRCYLLGELHCGADDRLRLARLIEMAEGARVPLVAANDVHYHETDRRPLQDVLTAIRHGCRVSELGDRIFPNGERYLKSAAQMHALFADFPAAVARTVEVADRCTFSLDELRYEYPEELAPPGVTPLEHLQRLAWEGAQRRYPQGIPEKVRGLIEHELRLIAELRYEAYFLTVWDLVRFARERGILCQGRGSAANSAVCYCLEVTSVDPDRIDVLFERFVSKERDEAPDIDVDFEHERREEVIQYIYEKYGRDRAGMTAEVISYRPRSAVRDVGKALGLSLDRVDRLAKSLEHYNEEERIAKRFREAGLNPRSRVAKQLIVLVRQILGFPRHLSQHVGGMVMTRGLLCEHVPIENASMPGRTVIEWDKDDLDALGILKVDCLALGMLTAIRRAFGFIERMPMAYVSQLAGTTETRRHGEKQRNEAKTDSENASSNDAHLSAATFHPCDFFSVSPCLRGENLDPNHETTSLRLSLASVPAEDPAVYRMMQRADTMGVFQIESRAQMAMLPRLRPRQFYDLVIEVAIVRPGPIQGDMVHPYLRRRNGEEAVEYPDERVREVLAKTMGVPIFQEQAMRLAVVAAGFTPGEADQLRRAMGAWRKTGVMDRFRQKLIDGMKGNGYSEEFAERVFNQIRGFGEYGFPESHAASFALLVYVSAWIKHYYPEAFCAALINSQPMGFYAPAQLVADARKHGVEVRPVDVNASAWDCTLEQGNEDRRLKIEDRRNEEANVQSSRSSIFNPRSSPLPLRLGFRLVRGMSQEDAQRIVACRGEGAFRSFDDFARRTKLSSAVLTRLSKADAFGSLAMNRRDALWQALPVQRELPLFDEPDEAPASSTFSHASAGSEPSRTVPDSALPVGARLNGKPDSNADEPIVRFPPMGPLAEVVADYRAAGLSLRDHPMTFVRPRLAEKRIVKASDLLTLRPDCRVRVAGLVLLRQRPGTASGITFVTLEDETGFANLIVRPDVWERFHQAARTAKVMLAHGRLQKLHQVIHVLADRLEDLSPMLADVDPRSRDFR